MEADLALVALFVGAFVLGVLRGALRQIVVLGAWLITFLLAAYLRTPLSDWLARQLTNFTFDYLEMLSMVIAFVALFGLALVLIETRGKTIHLSTRPRVDEALGGLLMLGVAILAVGTLVIALDTYYAVERQAGANEIALLRELHSALGRSAVVGALRDSLIPGLLALLGPLLPADVRALG